MGTENLINNEYYYENSFTILCTKKSEEILQNEISKNNYKCKECGSNLLIQTWMEGTFIVCEKWTCDHTCKCGYEILEDRYYKNPPVIIEN